MDSDFWFRPPKIFVPIFGKNLAEMGSKILVFGPIFAPRPHMGKIVRMDPKPS